jgi:intraflagellar transport protein 140
MGSNEFVTIVSPHKNLILILQWSQYGGYMVSGDSAGSIVGWKLDGKGDLIIMFHHILKQSVSQIAFKICPPKPAVDIG